MVETAEHIPCCAEMEQLRPAGSTVPGGEDVLLCGDLCLSVDVLKPRNVGGFYVNDGSLWKLGAGGCCDL